MTTQAGSVSHLCHAAGCDKDVPPRMLFCFRHWKMVPRALQQRVWAEYRPGQENDKKASLRYMAVQRAAVAAVAKKEGREDAEEWRVDSDMRRTMCREAGVGDPLEGVPA